MIGTIYYLDDHLNDQILRKWHVLTDLKMLIYLADTNTFPQEAFSVESDLLRYEKINGTKLLKDAQIKLEVSSEVELR